MRMVLLMNYDRFLTQIMVKTLIRNVQLKIKDMLSCQKCVV